jgi:hypothetical protein
VPISRKELIVCLLLVGIPVIAWLGSEVRWARINDPRGKFASASEYLASGRLPSRVTTINSNGSTFVIAYSPMDYGLAVPSGAAAYVFGESGRMVAWSGDTGDDGGFQRDWPLGQQEEASIEDLKRIGFQQERSSETGPADSR